MPIKVVKWIPVFGLVAWVISCGLNDNRSAPKDYDVVVTQPNAGYSFAEAATYAIVAQVPLITDPTSALPSPLPAAGPSPVVSVPVPDPSGSPLPGVGATSALSTTIIAEVVKQLNARGFQQLTDPAGPKPSFFVEAAVMETTNTQVYYDYWYPYFGLYYGSWYGAAYGYGWSSAAVPYVVQSTKGSVIVVATNPAGADAATKKLPVVWTAILNGPEGDTPDANAQARVQSGIAQAFTQSPYLQRGGP